MILLPRKNEDGKPRISYSQLNSWHELEAFNKITGGDGKLKSLSGKVGYILNYFFDYQFPASPMDIYAPFGEKVENAICNNDFKEFDARETSVLKTIKPLGIFQKEIDIDFGDFTITGFIDDSVEDESYLRDYKTCSLNSSKKYQKEDYYQLDIYSLANYRRSGKLPKKLEVCAIERKGSHFKPPLIVGDNVWYFDRPVSKDRLQHVENWVVETVKEISDVYKIFLKINL